MAKRQTASFIVRVTMPVGHDKRWVANYIRQAVEMWSGQDDPSGPTFYFCSPYHGGKTTVRSIKEDLADGT